MIVAVTGATGFVGSNLVRELLLQGHTVRALVHSPEPPPSLSDLALGQQASPPQLTFHRGDILDPGSLQRVFAGSEVVFHLAARISITRHDSEAVLRTNVEGPRNVAAACLESGVRRLVHFSSVHAMHVPPRDEPMDESTPLVADERAPAYDRSKSLGEREILRAVDKGLDAVIITPSGIMGPGGLQLGRCSRCGGGSTCGGGAGPAGRKVHRRRRGRLGASHCRADCRVGWQARSSLRCAAVAAAASGAGGRDSLALYQVVAAGHAPGAGRAAEPV